MSADKPNSPTKATCKHCGTPFSLISRPDSEFCCNGCTYVYKLIQREGFDNYYALRDSKIKPVNNAALQPRDYHWLEKLIAPIENEARGAEIVLDLEGISCVGCVWLIEKIFDDSPGSIRIDINLQHGQVLLQWVPGRFDVIEFAKEIQKYGYLLGPASEHKRDESNALLTKIGLCAAFALNSMLFTLPSYLGMESDFILADLFGLLALAFASLSLFVGGTYFINRAWRSLRANVLHVDLPIATGIVGAYIGSIFGWYLNLNTFLYFDFVSIFIFLMLVGRWLQEKALYANKNSILRTTPFKSTAYVVNSDFESGQEVTLNQLKKNDLIRILPGEINPVFSINKNQSAAFSLEWINGESEMRTFSKEQYVPAGALNIGIDPVILETNEIWKDSLLKRLVHQMNSSDRNPALEKVLRIYIGLVLLAALITGLIWLSLGEPISAAQSLLSILVVSCPCALGIAIPFIQEWSISHLGTKGVFIQKPSFFERLKNIKYLIFDKTGTLTLETPTLTNPLCLKELNVDELHVLKALSQNSLHPISRAIREALLEIDFSNFPPPSKFDQLHEVIGQGLSVVYNNETWTLGRPNWKGSTTQENNIQCVFSHNGKESAQFTFKESIRDNAPQLIQKLQSIYEVFLLSGDRENKVKEMCLKLGISPENGLAEKKPEEKEAWVKARPDGSTFYVGDGANDALAFNSASIRGTPATPNGLLQTNADFFFTGRDLFPFLDIFHTAKIRNLTIRCVFAFAITYNALAIGISATGHMHPLLAAILMPLSSLLTIGIVQLLTRRASSDT